MRNVALILGMVLAVLMIQASGCEKMQPAGMDETDGMEDVVIEGEGAEMPAPASQATVSTIVVGDTPFSVEIAATDEEKARGLAGRESLPENSGMWFVFAEPVQEKFWMQGMEIPLDLIFVDEDMQVVHIYPDAAPGSTELITSPSPYMYVLEINAGESEASGLKVGDKVTKSVGGTE